MKCNCDYCKQDGEGDVLYLADGTPACTGTLKRYKSLYGPLPEKWQPLRKTPLRKAKTR